MNKNFLEQSIYSDAISLIGGTSEEIEISLPEEKSCIGQYGRLHKEYLRKNHPDIYFELVHADTLWTYLADINGQVQRALQILSDSERSNSDYEQERQRIISKLIYSIKPSRYFCLSSSEIISYM